MKHLRRSLPPSVGLRLALTLLLLGCTYLFNLGTPPLWGDEAGTGIFARNLIQQGVPTGFDGRNLSIYDDGAELNADLVVVKLPWLQFYLGALSMRLFGDDANGLRMLFALTGALSLFPMWAVLRNRVPAPMAAAALVLVAPQVLLFHRNARYYPVLTLLFSLVAWIVCNEGLSRRSRTVLSGACLTVLYHTHPFAAATCCAGLLLQTYWQRDRFTIYLTASLFAFSTWLGWWIHVGPTIVAPTLFPDFQGLGFSHWPWVAAQNIGATLMDMDAVQGLPVLAWMLCLAWIFSSGTHRLNAVFGDPLVRLVGLTLTIHVVATAFLFGTETSEQYAVLRYMPHLVAMGMVLLLVMVGKAEKGTLAFAWMCVGILSTNLLTLSYWTQPKGAPIPLSWWPATYTEILRPRSDAWDDVGRVIHSHGEASIGPNGSSVLTVVPQWLQEVAIFYWGDQFIISPHLENAGSAALVKARVGDKAYANFRQPPLWILYAFPDAPTSVSGYERIQIPVHRARLHDGTRPELTRHSFYQDLPVGTITLYKKLP